MVELKEPFLSLWQGKDPFDEIELLSGKIFRALETRKTFRFELNQTGYFIKIHYGTTLKEVLKNLLSFRLPVLGADREWKAIHRLSEAGVDTMYGVAFGMRGINPLRITSFIITEELANTVSLEDYCRAWQQKKPIFQEKRSIIRRLAQMVRGMHSAGVNHRDCYLCHFLLHQPYNSGMQTPKLSVIDLHRAQIRAHVPLRWRNKDLIGLYFSSMDTGLSKTDILFFLKIYFDKSLKEIFQQEYSLLSIANKKAKRIKKRTLRKGL
ncbi:TPA: lipopolysaccharide core heptose(I) kinase RfaP [Citrobacter freundii]